jgi:predicted phage tail protein
MADSKKKITNLDGIIPPHWMSGLGDDPQKPSSMSPKDRIGMIEKAFQDVLCREPDTRDLNFYKYSSVSEEKIREELIESEEHKKLIENGREFKKTRNLLKNADSKIKSLEGKIEDQVESMKQMEILLKEKNLHIEDLKKKIQSPFENK